MLLLHPTHALIIGKPNGMGQWSEANVGIILTQRDTVFGARSKHTIGFINPFSNQVVDKDTYIGLRTRQYKGGATL